MKTDSRGQFMPVPVSERFWDKVEKGQSCWIWTGAHHPYGYGVIWNTGHTQRLRAHRVAWELTNGEIPQGKHVLHTCDRPACVNPAHLYIGTPSDNSRDMVERKRGPLGERNGNALLTASQVLDIRKHFPCRPGKTGPRDPSVKAIAKMLCKKHKISRQHLSRIAYRERWKHL
jgi:hypothetical protein